MMRGYQSQIDFAESKLRQIEAELEALEQGNYTMARLIRNKQVNPDEISGNSDSIPPGNSK